MVTMQVVKTALQVCPDCVMYIGAGQVTDGDGRDVTEVHAAAIAKEWSELGGMPRIELGSVGCDYCPSDEGVRCESWFSKQPCEGCGNPDAWEREHAVLFEEYPVTANIPDGVFVV